MPTGRSAAGRLHSVWTRNAGGELASNLAVALHGRSHCTKCLNLTDLVIDLAFAVTAARRRYTKVKAQPAGPGV